MNYDFTRHHRLRLAARNEGKIKSYASCIDIRAWSHDTRTRDRYLRDWMKCDMPVCVVPVCTLTSILTVMGCKRRSWVTSRCHPACQSKQLLDQISSSCHIMKECLKENKEFETYFKQEESNTAHWPCDKCLDILKSIKAFWNIVIEKVLNIHVPRSETDYKNVGGSIRNIAKEWKKEIVQEAIFVKSTSSLFKQNGLIRSETYSDFKNRHVINRHGKVGDFDNQNKLIGTECSFRYAASQTDDKRLRKTTNKCISANTKTVDTMVDAIQDTLNDELLVLYKNNIENYQQQFNVQKIEIDRLEKENMILNIKLENLRRNNFKNCLHCDPSVRTVDNTIALASTSFANDSEENVNSAKDIDSEMIITLKNCTNETFKHVSMLQILHKTNGQIFNTKDDSSSKHEDPIHLLNKVRNTFGAIVNREISIVKMTKMSMNSDVDIRTTYQSDVMGSKSVPSCSTTPSMTSESNFESAKDVFDTLTVRPKM